MNKNEYIEALNRLCSEKGGTLYDYDLILKLINKDEITCDGYKVEDLIVFANLLNYYQIDAQTLNSSIESIKLGYKICQDDFKKAMQDNLEKVMKNYE